MDYKHLNTKLVQHLNIRKMKIFNRFGGSSTRFGKASGIAQNVKTSPGTGEYETKPFIGKEGV